MRQAFWIGIIAWWLYALAGPLWAGSETWRGLIVAPEYRCSEYDPSDYRYPQSVEQEIAERQGGWFSPYTGKTFETPKDSDIEHIVARSEAHDSGLCAADSETRLAFSRDLDNLALAGPRLNRYAKSDRDAADWLPDQNRCWFARTVIHVKRKYELTVDPRERDALQRVLSECKGESDEVVD